MKEVELRAAETLLDKGVPVQLRAPFLLRLFGKKWINTKIGNPTGGTFIKINSYYLSMGVTVEDMANAEFSGIIAKSVAHTKAVYITIALAILNNRTLQFFFTKPLAWYLLGKCSMRSACAVYKVLVLQGGIEDFTTIIGLGAKLNMMTPKMSQTNDPTS